jgi:hypothetical protein
MVSGMAFIGFGKGPLPDMFNMHDPNAIDQLRFTTAVAFRWAALAKPRLRRNRPSA